ncbi:10676_t:CDS:1, partial [Ambispora leptoticha]
AGGIRRRVNQHGAIQRRAVQQLVLFLQLPEQSEELIPIPQDSLQDHNASEISSTRDSASEDELLLDVEYK